MGEKAAADHKFQMYDAEKGTFLGRTAISWLKITLFYIAYFLFLTGLFLASITLMENQLPENKPKLNTRLNIPGLNFFPKFNLTEEADKDRIGENDGIHIYYDSNVAEGKKGYDFYVNSIKKTMDKYDATSSFQDFDTATLGECATGKYGYDEGKPCVFFRLNRVIDWKPVGLFKPEKDSFFDLPANRPTKPMVRDATYVRCQAKDMNNDNAIVEGGFKYFGGGLDGEGYFEPKFFPYTGKNSVNMESYESPVVAVKIDLEQIDGPYKIECRAFGASFVHDDRKEGQITLFFQNIAQ